MTAAPEDGEFVPQDGDPQALIYHDAVLANVTALDANASSLAMVWGSALRSDRQALGDTRVATLAHGEIEVDCALYEATAGTIAAEFPIGSSVSVIQSTTAVAGATGRLVLASMKATGPAVADMLHGWSVGYVVGHNGNGALAPADDRPIKVHLYEKPRFVGQLS